MVSFTGHRDTGKSIMALASRILTRIALELGGKAPAIVWRDADLDVAVPAIVKARHANGGQVCTSAERVFVHAIATRSSSSGLRQRRPGAHGQPADWPGRHGPAGEFRQQLAKIGSAVRTAVK